MIADTNSTCANCSKRFNDNHNEIILFDCGHIIHSVCLRKYSTIKCTLCKTNRSEIIRYDVGDKYKQKNIDVLSLRKSKWVPVTKNYFNLFYRIPGIFLIGTIFLLNYSLVLVARYFENYIGKKMIGKLETYTHFNFFNGIARVLNLRANWSGLENIISDQKKIFISNHTSYYDAFVIGTQIRCGAIYSSSINNKFVEILCDLTPSMKINRGEKNNVVEKINKHIEKYSSIFMCPQGIFSHISTISKFRTGAFATNYNVQPIILKYKQDISSLSMFDMLLFDRVDIDVIVMNQIEKKNMNPREYANFTLDQMIEKSNLLKSNVTSYDVVD